MLQDSFTWKQLSAIAGVTFWHVYFRLLQGSVRVLQLIEFLTALTRQIEGKLFVIWGGLKADMSCPVREFLESQGDRSCRPRLPQVLRARTQRRRVCPGLFEEPGGRQSVRRQPS